MSPRRPGAHSTMHTLHPVCYHIDCSRHTWVGCHPNWMPSLPCMHAVQHFFVHILWREKKSLNGGAFPGERAGYKSVPCLWCMSPPVVDDTADIVSVGSKRVCGWSYPTRPPGPGGHSPGLGGALGKKFVSKGTRGLQNPHTPVATSDTTCILATLGQ